jgi:hypothetical protein
MKKAMQLMVVIVALAAFASASVVMAATEFYIVKDAQNHVSIVDKKPADAKSIVKGPFATKEEATKAQQGSGVEKSSGTEKPAVPPAAK